MFLTKKQLIIVFWKALDISLDSEVKNGVFRLKKLT